MGCVILVRCATIGTCSGHDYPPPGSEQVPLGCHIDTTVSCTLRPILRRYPSEVVDRCPYVRYTYIRYPVPDLPFPFPTYHPSEGTGCFSTWVPQASDTQRLCQEKNILAGRSSACHTPRPERSAVGVTRLSHHKLSRLGQRKRSFVYAGASVLRCNRSPHPEQLVTRSPYLALPLSSSKYTHPCSFSSAFHQNSAQNLFLSLHLQ